MQTPAIEVLAGPDLRILYTQYDEIFFEGCLSTMLADADSPISFHASTRLLSAGANIRVHQTFGKKVYRISTSAPVLHSSFREEGQALDVDGILCTDRLEALQVLMEHELVHLYELLLRGASNHGAGFQEIAGGLFGHTAFRHSLVTPREAVMERTGLRVGDSVSFSFEGRRRAGVIARITRRATVMVPATGAAPAATLKFYVPVAMLTKL